MKRLVLPGSILREMLIAGACLVVCTWCPQGALAQRVGGHVGGGGGVRMVPPRPVVQPMVRAPMARPLVPAGVAHGFGRPFGGFHHPFVFGPPFFGPPWFGYGANFVFDSLFWLTCGPFWGWQPGCGGAGPLEENGGYPNYVMAPVYQTEVYVYGQARPDRVQIFLKDGTIYNVTDYWFVNGQIHFTTGEEGERPIEQVLGMDDVDLARTIDVNTRHGFRFVMRNEPWPQYLREHPDETPPAVKVPERP